MLIHGVDNNDNVIPLLLDASGNVIVSASQLTTTGGKIKVDANGRADVLSYPHDVYTKAGATLSTSALTAVNQERTLITVPANSSLYITSLYMAINNTAAAVQVSTFRLYNATPAIFSNWFVNVLANSVLNVAYPFNPPLQMIEGYSLRIFSPSATLNVVGQYYGYLL